MGSVPQKITRFIALHLLGVGSLLIPLRPFFLNPGTRDRRQRRSQTYTAPDHKQIVRIRPSTLRRSRHGPWR